MDYEIYIRISKIAPLKYINLNITDFRVSHSQKNELKKNEKK